MAGRHSTLYASKQAPIVGVLVLLAPFAVCALLAVHSTARRRGIAATAGAYGALSQLLPGADLAVTSGSRAARFPSLVERGAQGIDPVLQADGDPATSLLGPYANDPDNAIYVQHAHAASDPHRPPAAGQPQ
jgi:hypothetical protein